MLVEIELKYKRSFTGADSIVVFQVCEWCVKKVKRYGYARREEEMVIMIS